MLQRVKRFINAFELLLKTARSNESSSFWRVVKSLRQFGEGER